MFSLPLLAYRDAIHVQTQEAVIERYVFIIALIRPS